MNAAETISVAIDKLERLKVESAPGPWELEPTGVYFDPRWDDVRVMRARDGDEPAYDRYIIRDGSYAADAGGFRQPDAELIVTLHRTIDAQLDWLRFVRGVAGAQINGGEAELAIEFGTQLARAILDGDS